MAPFQVWLVATLREVTVFSPFMHSSYGWSSCESAHFIGLSMLIGMIGTFDLRLLGVAKRIPIAALHRLIPWGIAGYAINVITGALFVITEPDQYIFNPAFHLKLLFMGLAGINVLAFYLTLFGRVKMLPPGADVPRPAKVVGAVSLTLWILVIICGRLLTFYRPFDCGPDGPGFFASCLPH
jgi:hypothetical protein